MPRNVNVPPQRVYGSVPMLLPLVKMSEAEATYMWGQPQIYDKNYPLDYDGLGLDPAYWAGTGAGGELNGLAGEVGGGNVKMMPWEHHYTGISGFGSLGLTAAQQKAAANKLAAQQKAAANKLAAANAAAQKKADAAKAAADKATAAEKARLAKIAAQDAARAIANCKSQKGTWNYSTQACDLTPATGQVVATNPTTGVQYVTKAPKPTAADKKESNCAAKGGTWDGVKCTLPLTANQQNTANQKACKTSGGTWDNKNKICASSKAQTACEAAGGTFANGKCTPLPGTPQTGGNCDPATQRWDAASMMCLPITPTTQPCPPPPSCYAGQIIGTDTNGCQVCVQDPNFGISNTTPQIQQQIAQCQQQGGYWNGSFCAPPQQYPQYPPQGPYQGPPQTSLIPPGFDSGGGGGSPVMSSGAQGGSMPMTQDGTGPGADLNDQVYASSDDQGMDQAAMVAQATDSGESGDGTDDSGTKDDTANVAGTSAWESITKLFGGGMNGLGCGCKAPPPWFGSGGGNAPQLGQFFTTTQADPIRGSTQAAVLGSALVLMVGAAAVFLWSKK